MARFIRALGMVFIAMVGFAACGLKSEGTGEVGPDGGGGQAGQSASGGVGGATCFPGSKVCPNSAGEPECLPSNSPETGCGTTSCDPCTLPNATAKCVGSGDVDCGIDQCTPGFVDCDLDPSNGCETNDQFDPTNCGGCSVNCTTGAAKVCENGVCVVDNCEPGTANCNGDNTSCEVDITSDPDNCGFCTNKCQFANAGAACQGSQCVITSCNGPYRDCDGAVGNGCEINSNTDTAHCGACNNACGSTNGVAGCLLGTCVILCTPPFGNCDNDTSNGCESNLNTTLMHCGGCGQACNAGNVLNVENVQCKNGNCDYDQCKPGFADCDNNRKNGCERDITTTQSCGNCTTQCTAPSGGSVVCNNGVCASSCSNPLTLCSGQCRNLTNDVTNCGSCNNNCPNGPSNSSRTCSGGVCGFSCNSGYTQCGDSCVLTASNPDFCGNCTTQCPSPPSGGTRVCVGGACSFTCSSPLTKCGSSCANLQNSSTHCGSCGNACTNPNGGTSCSSGTCSPSCDSGYGDCDGNPNNGCETDTEHSKAHCGGCNQPCLGASSCDNGQCGCSNGDETYCPGVGCHNLQTSNNHCGACGNACPGGLPCNNGSCPGGTGGG